MELNRSENILYQKFAPCNASIFYNTRRNRFGERVRLLASRFRLNAQADKPRGRLRDSLIVTIVYQTLPRRIVFGEYIVESISNGKKFRNEIVRPLKKFFGDMDHFLAVLLRTIDVP
jgi:hypothetical protein